MILELQILAAPKQIRFERTMHLTDNGTRSLCGLHVKHHIATAARQAGKNQPPKPCRRCQAALHSAARTARLVS